MNTPRSNGYRRGKWTQWIEFKTLDKAVYVSHSIDTLWKSYESNFSLSGYGGRKVEHIGFFNLSMATSLRERKLRIQSS